VTPALRERVDPTGDSCQRPWPRRLFAVSGRRRRTEGERQCDRNEHEPKHLTIIRRAHTVFNRRAIARFFVSWLTHCDGEW
jgi:hypothetical protein